jgi:hypothetical protein
MKSVQLSENQISAVVNYLLGTELSINVALHACYIDAEEPGYFANELDSVSQYYLEERIFKCAMCKVWSNIFEHVRQIKRIGETPACEICLMSPEDIFSSDSHFLRACGIPAEVLTVHESLLRCPDIAMGVRPNPNGLLLVTNEDLDFLLACGIRVRLSPKDTARRKLITDERENHRDH